MSAIGLGLDTTFDDTSVAILRGKREILSNLTLSQYKEHEEFGGVVPERASRKHLEVIHHIIAGALKEADLDFSGIDYIAVSNYPGLLGSLLVGLTVASLCKCSQAWRNAVPHPASGSCRRAYIVDSCKRTF